MGGTHGIRVLNHQTTRSPTGTVRPPAPDSYRPDFTTDELDAVFHAVRGREFYFSSWMTQDTGLSEAKIAAVSKALGGTQEYEGGPISFPPDYSDELCARKRQLESLIRRQSAPHSAGLGELGAPSNQPDQRVQLATLTSYLQQNAAKGITVNLRVLAAQYKLPEDTVRETLGNEGYRPYASPFQLKAARTEEDRDRIRLSTGDFTAPVQAIIPDNLLTNMRRDTRTLSPGLPDGQRRYGSGRGSRY